MRGERAVVREDPVATPELAHEGVRVGQGGGAARAPSDVADGEQGLDGVLAEEMGERAVRGG
jgi:hypothetical protein